MLPRRTATEILPGQQHGRALIARLVQHEVWIQRALTVINACLAHIKITQLIEKVGAETGTLDRFQELLGNNRISIDIGTIERRN